MAKFLGSRQPQLTWAIVFVLFSPKAWAQENVVVRGVKATPGTETKGRSEVTRTDIEERLPRSAPDALRYEPGVFVQETSHGQGSPAVRGRYGNRVLIVYDGVRLNNSTFRQGPNQYFFTLDSQTIRSIEVVRGGASTLFGTDALGGTILTHPMVPEHPDEGGGIQLHPRARVQYRSADDSKTYRGQMESTIGENFASIVGVGYTSAGLLRSGGPVRNPSNGAIAEVPRLADDGVTQLGTGYRILTGDVYARYWLKPNITLVAATNAFRQYDTPRTDQCPPPFGLLGDCTTIEEQFRTLAYVGLDGDLGTFARKTRIRVSVQRQHELRKRVRPISAVENGGRDDTNTLGISASMQTQKAELGPLARLGAVWGADIYRDSLDSLAWTRFTDIEKTFTYGRGQYISGSNYTTGGGFVSGQLDVASNIAITLGGRAGFARASAPADPEGGTPRLDRTWTTVAAEARTAYSPLKWLTVVWGVDRSFRAPNLDDLTSRQQTGPGFQIDNPSLTPESQITTEVGVLLASKRIKAEAWTFRSYLINGIDRSPRGIEACPAGASSDACASSWSRYQVVNSPGPGVIYGAEAALRLRPTDTLKVQGTLSWTYGEGPNLGGSVPWGQRKETNARVPLSRMPPTNGTVETRLAFLEHYYSGIGMRWALEQTRLSVSDRSDYRIPNGGTPGYVVFDLRTGYRYNRSIIVNVTVENVTNQAYRTHGSGINGAGRGVGISIEGGL